MAEPVQETRFAGFANFRLKLATRVLTLLGARFEQLPDPPAPYTESQTPDHPTLEKLTPTEIEIRLSLEPDDPRLLGAHAAIAVQRNDYKAALTDYERAIHISPDDSALYSGRALAHLSINAREQAIADCDTALRLNPDNPDAYQLRGTGRAESKDLSGAEADFQAFYRLRPTNARGISNFAWLRLLRRDHDVAFRLAEDALMLDPVDATAHFVLGVLYAHRKQREQAITAYRHALDGWPNPDSPQARQYTDGMRAYIERWAEAPPEVENKQGAPED